MSITAFMPLRGGSKSIIDKNIRIFCGKPLVFWVLKELQNSIVDEIIVATDSQKIKNIVNDFYFSKVKTYDRIPKNAQDDSSTESVMLEYISSSKLKDKDIFMLVQATSPFTQVKHFNEGLHLLEEHDSVLSCTIDKKFAWSEDGCALNYDINNRPRRQDFKGNLIENGAFYISSVVSIKNSKNRISGDIGIYQMPDYSFIEIDEPLDWVIAESIMHKLVLFNKEIDFSKIKIFLSDVDGVLTDSGMYYTEKGDEFKKFCTYDGMAFKMLQASKIKTGIITSEDRRLNRARALKLNLDFHFHGVQNKLKVVKELCKEEQVTLDQIAYIGDDINCLELLSNVGIAACPNNAMHKIQEIPNIIKLNKNGGEGVVREFVEKIIN